MTERVNVSFEFYDFDFNPNEITTKLGIKPTEAWIKGDMLPWGPQDKPLSIKARSNKWSIDSGAKTEESVEIHLERLLTLLIPYVDKIRTLTASCPSMVRLSAVYDGHYPGIVLSHKTIEGLSALGTELDQDITIYNSLQAHSNSLK